MTVEDELEALDPAFPDAVETDSDAASARANPVRRPIAIGYGAHFGLGLFAAVKQDAGH